MQTDYVITRKSNYVLIANIFHSCSDFNRFKFIHDTQKYSSNKIVKDNHSALYYRNILLAVNVIISCVCIEIYRGPLSWPPRQGGLVQVISKCLIYTATHFFFISAITKSRARVSFITCTRYKKYRSVHQRRYYVLLPWYIVFSLHREIL